MPARLCVRDVNNVITLNDAVRACMCDCAPAGGGGEEEEGEGLVQTLFDARELPVTDALSDVPGF